MDHWEAHYLVKWQREELVSRQQLAIQAGIPLDDLKHVVRLWFNRDDEDD